MAAGPASWKPWQTRSAEFINRLVICLLPCLANSVPGEENARSFAANGGEGQAKKEGAGNDGCACPPQTQSNMLVSSIVYIIGEAIIKRICSHCQCEICHTLQDFASLQFRRSKGFYAS